MIKKVITAALAIAALAIGLAATAQNGTMTPYSRFGYGILSDHATSAQRAMGGVGYAMNSGRQINVMNPAAYAAMDSLTFLFDMGIDLTSLWSSEVDDEGKKVSAQDFGGGLDYATMQVPLCKFLGASVGLVPYSSVGYSFGSEIENGVASRQGSGSINELYAGIGGCLFRGFSIGANISYMFGTIVNDNYAVVSSTQNALFQRQIEVRDYNLNFGAQYGFYINPANRITLGLVYSPGKSFLGHAKSYQILNDANTAPELYEEKSLKGNYSRPDTWGAGVNYTWRNSLMIEADLTYQPWDKAKFLTYSSEGSTPMHFAKRYKGALGLQWLPDSRGGYLKRIRYRIGGYYNRDYLIIKGNNVREHGLSLGFGFPVPTFKTIVNLGVEWKHRQATPNALIKEDYLNITLGINFNEMWFNKSKIY